MSEKKVLVVVDETVWRRVKARAAERSVSVGTIVTRALRFWLTNGEADAPVETETGRVGAGAAAVHPEVLRLRTSTRDGDSASGTVVGDSSVVETGATRGSMNPVEEAKRQLTEKLARRRHAVEHPEDENQERE